LNLKDWLNKFRINKSRFELLEAVVLVPLRWLYQSYETKLLRSLLINGNLKATREILEIGVWIKVKSEFVLIVYQLIT
jgi:hypothetical protein